MRLLYLLSWTAYWLIDLSVLWLMSLVLVMLIMMVADVYASRRRSSDRCSCRGMHQLDLEGSSLWCCSLWNLPTRGYSRTYTIENNLSFPVTMSLKIYDTTQESEVWNINGNNYLGQKVSCNKLAIWFLSSQRYLEKFHANEIASHFSLTCWHIKQYQNIFW